MDRAAARRRSSGDVTQSALAVRGVSDGAPVVGEVQVSGTGQRAALAPVESQAVQRPSSEFECRAPSVPGACRGGHGRDDDRCHSGDRAPQRAPYEGSGDRQYGAAEKSPEHSVGDGGLFGHEGPSTIGGLRSVGCSRTNI
ncbi:hypothetical protein B005_2388 [Nocardiopsis alba ATCC BAA-2165]|uniref:Uncharacterized protein n=1 Tax=Nocardiopsis alba (strain ATCC BAA-2165 / BE74) TaxID=1205910 RepID=J7LI62_NOCAA|nr:hypothetical protein B005_2388 [Nocardiopsis alba ATCC BAA-2165]